MSDIDRALLQVAREVGAAAGEATAERLTGEILRRLGALQRSEASQLRTVKQMTQECPAWTENSLRALLKESDWNGLESTGAVLRSGGRGTDSPGEVPRVVQGKKRSTIRAAASSACEAMKGEFRE